MPDTERYHVPQFSTDDLGEAQRVARAVNGRVIDGGFGRERMRTHALKIMEFDASDRDHADAAREIYEPAVKLALLVLGPEWALKGGGQGRDAGQCSADAFCVLPEGHAGQHAQTR